MSDGDYRGLNRWRADGEGGEAADERSRKQQGIISTAEIRRLNSD